MWRDHLTAKEADAYQHQTLAPAALLEVSDHLAECVECRERLLSLAREDREDGANLFYEELVEYFEGGLDPLRRREISDKLWRSPKSMAELADLTRFRDEMHAQPPQIFGEPVRPTERVVHVFPGFQTRWLLPLAAAIALTGTGVWWTMRGSNDREANALALQDAGHRITLHADGRVSAAPQLSEEMQSAVATAMRDGQLDIPTNVKALGSRRGTLAGGPNESSELRVLSPVATAVRSLKPQFRWTAQPGASAYRIYVADLETGEVVFTGRTNGAHTTWIPAEPLNAGGFYQWQVEALRGDEVVARMPKPPEPEARFAIISDGARIKVEQAEKSAGGSNLAKAVAAADAGLLEEATDELQALAKENPDSKIPKQLLAEVEKARAGQQQ